MIKKLIFLTILICTSTAAFALPTYTGFTSRSSGYVVTDTDWNNEFGNFISHVNTHCIGTLNLLLAKGNILGSDGTNIAALTNAGATDDSKVLTLDSTQTLGIKWASPGTTNMTTSGDMVYWNSGNQRLPIGTTGQVLTVSGGLPTWATNASTPAGIIAMWGGAIGSIPSGWRLCDGTNGTPNLQGLFILGAGNVSPAATSGFGLAAIGSTGGGTTHAHTQSGSQQVGSGAAAAANANGSTGSATSAPSYYALAYIQKM